MPFEFIIDKNTAFYYWAQAVSQWDLNPSEPELYSAYFEELTESDKPHAMRIKSLLSESKDPRKLLASMYLGTINSVDAHKLAEACAPLLPTFEAYWQNSKDIIAQQNNELNAHYADQMNASVHIINSLFSNEPADSIPTKVFLLPNLSAKGSSGHVITGTNFILLHPAGPEHTSQMTNTVATLLHEYTHVVEFNTPSVSALMKSSYEKIGSPAKPPLQGYSWRMHYSEMLAYCLANNITGGYLKSVIAHSGSVPRPEDFKVTLNKLVKEGSISTGQYMSWFGLLLTPTAEAYLADARPIDSDFADTMSKILLKYT